MHVRGPDGSREIEADDFFTGAFTTSMAATEILTHVSVPTGWTAWSFQEAAVKAGDYGLALVAAVARVTRGAITESRLSVGAAVGSVTRIKAVEELLAGATPTAALADEAGRLASESVSAISDIHGSSSYRRALLGTLVRRAVIDLENGA